MQNFKTPCVLMVALAIPGAWAFEPAPDSPFAVAHAGGSFLGVSAAELTAERARALTLPEERGVEVTRVEEDSPAGKAGVRVNDVVLEFNGQRVEGLEQFMRLVRETPPGREVRLSIARGGSQQQISLRTAARRNWVSAKNVESVFELSDLPRIDLLMPDVPRALMSWRNSLLGIETESLDSQLAEFFGVKEGVLVRSVMKGSQAEKAGLKAGDVIVRVDDTKVATAREVTAAVRSARSRKAVTIAAVREKKEMTMSVPLESQGGDGSASVPGSRSIARHFE